MQTVQLQPSDLLPAEVVETLGGTLLDDDSYNLLANEDMTVLKPDGSVLFILLKNVLSAGGCRSAWQNLRDAAASTDNRGMAGGVVDPNRTRSSENIGPQTGTRYQEVRKDGTVSRVQRANVVNSGIVGYFDRSPRFPYCRTTAYNLKKGHQFEAATPFIREIDAIFAAEYPERYQAQKAHIEQTSPDFYIPGTVFTTVTVNRNWQTAVHKDQGDLAEGFGVLTALCAGDFLGCYLCFPEYQVAANLRTGDVILADVHEWHGNTPFVGVPGNYERLSFVLYYRNGMRECGNAAEELARAKDNPIWAKSIDERGKR